MERSNCGSDRISDLPDCVLFYILSKLPLRALVRTTVLSKRWLRLDLLELKKDLHFDLHNMFESNELKEFKFLRAMTYDSDEILNETFDRIQSKYVRRVDQFMQRYQAATAKVYSLRVDFFLCFRHRNMIDRLIGCAIAKGVERIEVICSDRTYFFPGIIPPYLFPHRLLSESDGDGDPSCVKYLHLQNCLLEPPAEFFGFKNLRTLVLEDFVLEKNLLLCLFSKCFHLEYLILSVCEFLSKDDVDIISPILRHLTLINISFSHRSGKINIVTSQLSSFEYSGNILRISSIDAPQLSKFFLRPCADKKKIQIPPAFAQIAKFKQLEILTLHLCEKQIARLPRAIGPFQHLRQLELYLLGTDRENVDYLWVLNIVMASPRLQKLSFTIIVSGLFENQRQRKEHPGFSHNELKYVELRGCVGNMYEIELASHFLKNVSSLGQISFSPYMRHYLGAGKWAEDDYENADWIQRGRNLIREMLQDEVNEQARLIFL